MVGRRSQLGRDYSKLLQGMGCTGMDEHFPAQLQQLVTGDICDMWSAVVVKGVVVVVLRAAALNLTCQTIQFFAVQLCNDAGSGCQQIQQHHVFAVQPN